jgi:hypothetical protein
LGADEALVGFSDKAAFWVLGYRKIQGALDGLGLGFQDPLRVFDFPRVQLKMLVRAFLENGHRPGHVYFNNITRVCAV